MQTNTNIVMHRCLDCKRRTANYCYDDDDHDDNEIYSHVPPTKASEETVRSQAETRPSAINLDAF